MARCGTVGVHPDGTRRGTRPPTATPPPMIAREYFALFDAITGAPTPEQLVGLEARLAATSMHPLERGALERVARQRRLALAVDAEARRPSAVRAD